jgi:hypothetical protein
MNNNHEGENHGSDFEPLNQTQFMNPSLSPRVDDPNAPHVQPYEYTSPQYGNNPQPMNPYIPYYPGQQTQPQYINNPQFVPQMNPQFVQPQYLPNGQFVNPNGQYVMSTTTTTNSNQNNGGGGQTTIPMVPNVQPQIVSHSPNELPLGNIITRTLLGVGLLLMSCCCILTLGFPGYFLFTFAGFSFSLLIQFLFGLVIIPVAIAGFVAFFSFKTPKIGIIASIIVCQFKTKFHSSSLVASSKQYFIMLDLASGNPFFLC